MTDLTFYTNPQSRGRVVRWMLEEVGAPYETKVIDYATMKSPDYLAVNPMGKVPAIKHGDEVVTETAAICAYLADIFPEANLIPPPGHRKRGCYYRWLFFAAGPVEAAVTNKAMGFELAEGKGRAELAGDVLALADHALQGVDHRLEAAVAGGAALAFGQLEAHRLVGHRRLDRPGGEEQPAVVGAAVS